MALEGSSAQIFDDLFDKGVADVKEALTRASRMMHMEEPDSNASIMLILGVLVSCYASALEATVKVVELKGLPGDYATAAAGVETFDQTVTPIVDRLRALVAEGRTKGGSIAEALAEVERNRGDYKMEATSDQA